MIEICKFVNKIYFSVGKTRKEIVSQELFNEINKKLFSYITYKMKGDGNGINRVMYDSFSDIK